MIQHMWDQEKHHLATFDKLIPERRARPTALLPFWHVAGFALGAGTALLGKEGAMACTVAVEASITEHYNDQIRELTSKGSEEHRELIATISKFRDEEQEHHDIGLENDAELAPAYQLLSGSIKVVFYFFFYKGVETKLTLLNPKLRRKNLLQVGCKAAIWLSERI